MAKNWLCKIGLHRNRDIWRGEWNGVTQKVVWRCTRCEQQESFLLVSPLSGPRRGEMYPDAKVVESARKAWG